MIGNQENILREYYISEYEKQLEANEVDTVCFMGYGYKFEDVKVGAEFYFSYLYYGRNSVIRNDMSPKDVLKHLISGNIDKERIFDRYKLIQKYKYYDCKIIDHKNKKLIDARQRREFVKIRNLRTNQIFILNQKEINYFHLLCFVTW